MSVCLSFHGYIIMLSPPVGTRTFKPTWCVIRERRVPVPVTVSLFHTTGNHNSSMVDVFPPVLAPASVLLMYAITTFSGNINSRTLAPVTRPAGRVAMHADISGCNLSCLAEQFPAGTSQQVPAHPCPTPLPYANDISWCLSRKRDAMCSGMAREHSQCWS